MSFWSWYVLVLAQQGGTVVLLVSKQFVASGTMASKTLNRSTVFLLNGVEAVKVRGGSGFRPECGVWRARPGQPDPSSVQTVLVLNLIASIDLEKLRICSM